LVRLRRLANELLLLLVHPVENLHLRLEWFTPASSVRRASVVVVALGRIRVVDTIPIYLSLV
jgi:hypothetical protein